MLLEVGIYIFKHVLVEHGHQLVDALFMATYSSIPLLADEESHQIDLQIPLKIKATLQAAELQAYIH